MSSNPMDMVIGASETQRDARAAAKHLEAARAADKAGERERAIIELKKATAADPQNVDVLFELAYRLDLVGEEDEALATYERATDRGPASTNTLMNLAVMYDDRGDYARAERCLRQVLESHPNHPRARLYMKDVQASREMMVDDEQDRDYVKRKAMMDTPVTDFELSVRARTCLKKLNIRTLSDLLRYSEAELLSYKNFGESSLTEIKAMLAGKGFRLGQGADDAYRQARRSIADQLKGSGREQVLNKPVGDLQLSVRARKALQLLNIQTMGDLASRTEAELMGVKNFGATSLQEVKERLAEAGLGLRTLDEP
ncbi:MAG: tetratricopeptide repeat protein [Phycisphaerales bacterium]|nr:tetratricopeptide repeat protein [Phycisphaerales bacterium]